ALKTVVRHRRTTVRRQISVHSTRGKASSTSTPRYLTVFSIFVCVRGRDGRSGSSPHFPQERFYRYGVPSQSMCFRYVRSRHFVDTAPDEIRAPRSYVMAAACFCRARFRPATPSIFERSSMTRFREPTLVDLLNDPIIQLVMRADGVTKDDIRELY